MEKQFVLMDVDRNVYEVDRVLNAQTTNIRSFGSEWSIRLQRLHGGLSDGVDVVWVDNGCTRLAILPTRGMGIWKANVAGVPLEWHSPVQRPVHPTFVDQSRRGGIGWLDGFNELICRCGLGWHGAPGTDVIRDADGDVVSEQFLPLHGRIANLPAHSVTVEISDDGAISIVGVVDEAGMFGGHLRLTAQLTTYVGSNTFEIRDTVQNLSAGSAEAEMLYHCNIGRPFVGEGAKLHIAASEVAPRDSRAAEGISDWPTYAGPVQGYAEQVYFVRPLTADDGRALAVLAAPEGDRAVAVRFDTSTLPWFAQWKSTQAEADGYVTGLEPCSSFPNLRSFERQQNRVVQLDPMGSVTFEFAVTVVSTADDVSRLVQEVADLQQAERMTVHDQPNPEWSP